VKLINLSYADIGNSSSCTEEICYYETIVLQMKSFERYAVTVVFPDGLKRKFLRRGNAVQYDKPSPEYDTSAFIPVEMKAGSLILLHGDVIHQRFCPK